MGGGGKGGEAGERGKRGKREGTLGRGRGEESGAWGEAAARGAAKREAAVF